MSQNIMAKIVEKCGIKNSYNKKKCFNWMKKSYVMKIYPFGYKFVLIEWKDILISGKYIVIENKFILIE